MKRELIYILQVFLFSSLFFTTLPLQAQTKNQQETLNQYIEKLNSYNFFVLPQWVTFYTRDREEIIRFSQKMRPPPEIPEETRKYIAQGIEAFRIAKNELDYYEAAQLFMEAIREAPWLGIAYLNFAITAKSYADVQIQSAYLEKYLWYGSALKSLDLYLLTNLSQTEIIQANDLKYKIEFHYKKAKQVLDNQ